MFRFLSIAVATATLALVGTAAAQNRDHPGLVHLGKGEWGTVEQAREAGLIEYRGRWFPARLERKLKGWERLDAKGLGWKQAYKARTDAYRVQTNLPRFIFELEVRPFLDELAKVYAKVFAREFGLEGRAFRNKDLKIYYGFEDYNRQEHRSRRNPGFIQDGAILSVLYEDCDPGQFYGTMFHEGAHQFFLSLLPGAEFPTWLKEALAVYFEGCTYSRATAKITVGHLPEPRLWGAQLILGQEDGSAHDLFMRYSDEQFEPKHYGLAWSFIYYLTHGVDGCDGRALGEFLRKANGAGDRPLAEIFKNTTDLDLDELEAGWRDYVRALKPDDEIPYWVVLDVDGAGPDENLRSDDRVISIDGVYVFGAEDFQKLWKSKREKPVKLTVMRETHAGGESSRREIVEVTIAPDSAIRIEGAGMLSRRGNLRD